ncbi:patatin-like phospholipase family protein [Neisseriaceae bacterium TC5R-5]|nr:patatin-like phospholipase family protein [Neisseriaceae bacterium TC5R-5]
MTAKLNPACPHTSGIYQSRSLPEGHRYQVLALVLQGGGALGSYQPGVYQGLAEADLHPNWVAGISIGALNAAIIAGNPPERRVEQLRAFWETICQPPFLPASPFSSLDDSHWPGSLINMASEWQAWRAMTEGQNGFFTPRSPWHAYGAPSPGNTSYYDTAPLKRTLEAFADFDRINDSREMRVSVGAVNVRTGNFIYFDNTHQKLRAEHFMASGSLPPGFPAVEIDGEFYWDGGVVSNTPLKQILASEPRKHSLVFQVDLWSAQGTLPTNLADVVTRQKDIQYSSRTRMITDAMQAEQRYRALLQQLMQLVPAEQQQHASYHRAQQIACGRLLNIIHLIYQDKTYDGDHHKDYQFGPQTMRARWDKGYQDIHHSLQQPHWLAMPEPENPFVTHDIHR